MKEHNYFDYDKTKEYTIRFLPQWNVYEYVQKKKYYKFIDSFLEETELEKQQREKRELRNKKLKRILKDDPEVIIDNILN